MAIFNSKLFDIYQKVMLGKECHKLYKPSLISPFLGGFKAHFQMVFYDIVLTTFYPKSPNHLKIRSTWTILVLKHVETHDFPFFLGIPQLKKPPQMSVNRNLAVHMRPLAGARSDLTDIIHGVAPLSWGYSSGYK